MEKINGIEFKKMLKAKTKDQIKELRTRRRRKIKKYK
jgi:hypothetical protein